MGNGDVEDQRAAVDLLRRRVLNVVGHELRTPITTLRGLAELLGESSDPAADAELYEAIKRTARRTEALLDDLLVATGVSTALPVGDPVATPVAATAREAWAAIEGGPPGDLAVDGDGVVLAPKGVLRRIFDALLDNAARYGAAPYAIQVLSDGDEVVVCVSDHGSGIPAAELPLVTEPFFRGERAVLTHHSLGLGLAVVAALVAHDEGAVQVRNREGGGIEIELRLRSDTV